MPLLVPSFIRALGQIRASFEANGTRTQLARAYESGGWRLRYPRVTLGCEAVIINTGGGMAGGDKASLVFEAGCGSNVTLTTAAAEKIYPAQEAETGLALALNLDAGARLEWLPQETILFDGAKLTRRLTVDMAADASLLLVESTIFGRLAKGETCISGALHESWRVRRASKLVFAEETRVEGGLGALLDRPAIGDGARSAGVILFIASEAEAELDALRTVLAAFSNRVEYGASARNGVLVVRLLSASPEASRAAILAGLAQLRDRAAPRVWQ